ncbi:hypothetical protein Hdeb2414_s0416g00888981 [Helianthus debilis subsp. tardiflorus]
MPYMAECHNRRHVHPPQRWKVMTGLLQKKALWYIKYISTVRWIRVTYIMVQIDF